MRENTYFGDPWNANVAGMEQTPAPVGTPCLFCRESIEVGDRGLMIGDGSEDGQNPLHRECFVRMTSGSVAHQKRTCRCFGGTEEDPPGLTPREAARAADRHAREQFDVGPDVVLEGNADA